MLGKSKASVTRLSYSDDDPAARSAPPARDDFGKHPPTSPWAIRTATIERVIERAAVASPDAIPIERLRVFVRSTVEVRVTDRELDAILEGMVEAARLEAVELLVPDLADARDRRPPYREPLPYRATIGYEPAGRPRKGGAA